MLLDQLSNLRCHSSPIKSYRTMRSEHAMQGRTTYPSETTGQESWEVSLVANQTRAFESDVLVHVIPYGVELDLISSHVCRLAAWSDRCAARWNVTSDEYYAVFRLEGRLQRGLLLCMLACLRSTLYLTNDHYNDRTNVYCPSL